MAFRIKKNLILKTSIFAARIDSYFGDFASTEQPNRLSKSRFETFMGVFRLYLPAFQRNLRETQFWTPKTENFGSISTPPAPPFGLSWRPHLRAGAHSAKAASFARHARPGQDCNRIMQGETGRIFLQWRRSDLASKTLNTNASKMTMFKMKNSTYPLQACKNAYEHAGTSLRMLLRPANTLQKKIEMFCAKIVCKVTTEGKARFAHFNGRAFGYLGPKRDHTIFTIIISKYKCIV